MVATTEGNKPKPKSKSKSGSSSSWIKDLLFVIFFLIILYILIFIIYMFYLLLWCLDMLPNVMPVPVVDMIKRIAFFFVQITLPFFWILMMFVIIAYIVYCIIKTFIPENVLGIPMRELALMLPPLPPFIEFGIFGIMDAVVGLFAGVSVGAGSASVIATNVGATGSMVGTFGMEASGSLFEGVFPGFDQSAWSSLFTGQPDANGIAKNIGTIGSGPIDVSGWNQDRLKKDVDGAFNIDVSSHTPSLDGLIPTDIKDISNLITKNNSNPPNLAIPLNPPSNVNTNLPDINPILYKLAARETEQCIINNSKLNNGDNQYSDFYLKNLCSVQNHIINTLIQNGQFDTSYANMKYNINN